MPQLSQQDQSLLEEFHNDDDSDNDDLLFDRRFTTFSLSQQSAAASASSSSSASSKEQRQEQQQQQQKPHASSSTSPGSATAVLTDDDHHQEQIAGNLAMTTTSPEGGGNSSSSNGGGDVIMSNATDKNLPQEEVNRRAAKKARYASMDQVKNVTHASFLRWHVIKKTKYYPCVIRDNEHQQAFAKDLKVQLNKQKPLLIEYLGFRDKVSTGKLAAASKSSLLPFDYDSSNNNDKANSNKVKAASQDDDESSTAMPAAAATATTAETAVAAAAVAVEWSPTLMASYEKLLKSQSAFATEDENVHVKARAEVMALNRMLQDVVQRQEQKRQEADGGTAFAAAFSLTQQPSEEEEDEEEEDDDEESLQDDNDMMQSDAGEPQQQQEQQADSSPSTGVATAAAAAAPASHTLATSKNVNTLRAGDVITYFLPGATACPESRRTAQIVAVYPRGQDGIFLHLEDGTMLDREEKVLLVKRLLRKQLVPVQSPTWRYMNSCKLSNKNNDQFSQARHDTLYRGANMLKDLQEDLQREQDAFWQQGKTSESNSKAAATGASTTATAKPASAKAASKKDSGDDNGGNDDAASDDDDAPNRRPQQRAKQDASKKKCTQKENVDETEISNISTTAAAASKKRQRLSDVSVGRNGAARTSDIGGENQSKRNRKGSDQGGTTTLPVKEKKRVHRESETTTTLSMAKNEKKKQKKNEVSWKGALQPLLEAVLAQRKKSRYDRERVQAQEDNITTAMAICAHLESSSSSSTTSTTTTLSPFSTLLEQAVMDEIADDCEVPTDRLVNYLRGNERNLIFQADVVELTESLKRWLQVQQESQKEDVPLQPSPDKETTHVENPLQEQPSQVKTETSNATAAPCAVSKVAQSSGVVPSSSFVVKESSTGNTSQPPIDDRAATTQPELTTTTTTHDEIVSGKTAQNAPQEPTAESVVQESSSLPAVKKSGTENDDATQVHLSVQPKEDTSITPRSELVSSVEDAQQVQQDMPCPIPSATISTTLASTPVSSCPAVSTDVVLATVRPENTIDVVQQSSSSLEETKINGPCKKDDSSLEEESNTSIPVAAATMVGETTSS